MRSARYWMPLDTAARYHHRLLQIHPFPNDNGRHARIAIDIMLERVYRRPLIEWVSDFNPLLVFVGARDTA